LISAPGRRGQQPDLATLVASFARNEATLAPRAA
jgi:hypothetical protein